VANSFLPGSPVSVREGVLAGKQRRGARRIDFGAVVAATGTSGRLRHDVPEQKNRSQFHKEENADSAVADGGPAENEERKGCQTGEAGAGARGGGWFAKNKVEVGCGMPLSPESKPPPGSR